MELLEKKKYLASILTKDSIIKNGTTLLMGEAARIFKSIFSGNIISITTAEEVKDFIDNYSKESEEILVFEDISLMNTQVQTYLLKYLESNYRPLVVLASVDNLSPVLLSRFVKVVKLPQDVKSDSVPLNTFLEEHAMDLKSNYVIPELKEESLLYCPQYFYNLKKMSLCKHENKNRNQLIRYI